MRGIRFRTSLVNFARLAQVLALCLFLAPLTGAQAQTARGGNAFAVRGVAADDVLNIRNAPGGDQIIGSIPPNGRGIVALGPKTRTGGGTWMQIRFGSTTGWVNQRFLTPDTLQTATATPTSSRRGVSPSGNAALGPKSFEGTWSHEQWSLVVDPDQVTLAPLTGSMPSRLLMLGSKDCGVIYDRTDAMLPISAIASTFTDPRFEAWASATSRTDAARVMVVTCGSPSHRFVFLLTNPQKLLVAEWDATEWKMLEEFSSSERRIGRQ